MMSLRVVVFCIFAVVVVPGVAVSGTSTYAEKMKRLAEVEKVSESMTDYKNACLEKVKQFDPNQLVISQPDMFAGVRPNSKHWPKVVAAFKDYVNTSCNFISEKDYLAEYVRTYSPLLDEKSLDAILKFYATPQGKAYLKASHAGQFKLQSYLVKKQTDKTKAAMDVYANKLKEIGKANGTLPK